MSINKIRKKAIIVNNLDEETFIQTYGRMIYQQHINYSDNNPAPGKVMIRVSFFRQSQPKTIDDAIKQGFTVQQTSRAIVVEEKIKQRCVKTVELSEHKIERVITTRRKKSSRVEEKKITENKVIGTKLIEETKIISIKHIPVGDRITETTNYMGLVFEKYDIRTSAAPSLIKSKFCDRCCESLLRVPDHVSEEATHKALTCEIGIQTDPSDPIKIEIPVNILFDASLVAKEVNQMRLFHPHISTQILTIPKYGWPKTLKDTLKDMELHYYQIQTQMLNSKIHRVDVIMPE
jgi:hypothetical protein